MSMYDPNSPDPCGLIGKVFGKLTVIGYDGHYRSENRGGHIFYWYKVRCSCRLHTEFLTTSRDLVSGNTSGCPKCKRGEPVLPGDVFGCLTVKEILPPKEGRKHSRAVCECSCPKHTIVTVNITNLKTGTTATCGDGWHYIQKEYKGSVKLGMQPDSDIEVLEISETKRTKNHERIAICKCHHVNPITNIECGKVFETTVSNIATGNTTSCGCAHYVYPNEETRRLGSKWFAMKSRCHLPTNKWYPEYGGRGISVTPEWDMTAEGRYQFVKDGIKKGFILGQSIDRIDNDGNYEFDNIRFTNQTRQNNNKRNNHYIEAKGMKFTAADWARKLHVNYAVLANHLRCVVDESEYMRRLIDHELLITDRVPYDLRNKIVKTRGYFTSKNYLTIDGEKKLYPQWEQHFGVRAGFINTCIKRGMTIEQVIDRMKRWKECDGNPHYRRSDRIITVDGVSLNVMDWSRKLNLPYTLLCSRIRNTSEEDVIQFIRERSQT